MLDLSCRSGAFTRHFLEGNTIVGLDVDAAALAKASELGIEPVVANVEEPLPFEDASFDVVVAGELRAFSPSEIRTLLADFDVVRIEFVGGRYRRLSPRLLARDLVFRASRP